MPQELSYLFDLFWQIIKYCWEGIFAFFHLEEWLVRLFKNHGIPVWVQLVTLLPFNTVMIGVESLLFKQLRRFKIFFRKLWLFAKSKSPLWLRISIKSVIDFIRRRVLKNSNNRQTAASNQTPQFLLSILNGRPIGRRVLFLLALIPELQKVGSFVFAINMEKFGWQGYMALCLGGATRLTITILSPMWVLWTIVISAMSIRVIIWLFKRLTVAKEEE